MVLDTLYNHEFHRDTLSLWDMNSVYDLPDKMEKKPKYKFTIKKLQEFGYLDRSHSPKLTKKGYKRRERLRKEKVKTTATLATFLAILLGAIFTFFAITKDSFILCAIHSHSFSSCIATFSEK